MRLACGRREPLHCFGNSSMQQGTLTRQKLHVDGLPCQCVSKCELFAGFFDHELGSHQFIHNQDELLFIKPGKLLQEDKIKMPPGDSSQGQHLSGCFPQVLCSLLHRVLNAWWNACGLKCFAISVTLDIENVTCCNHSTQRFFNEKGVAFRQGVERIQ